MSYLRSFSATNQTNLCDYGINNMHSTFTSSENQTTYLNRLSLLGLSENTKTLNILVATRLLQTQYLW